MPSGWRSVMAAPPRASLTKCHRNCRHWLASPKRRAGELSVTLRRGSSFRPCCFALISASREGLAQDERIAIDQDERKELTYVSPLLFDFTPHTGAARGD